MLTVRPRELANACALFGAVRTGQLPCGDLQALVRRGLPLDCSVSAEQIISACLQSGLVTHRGTRYLLSGRGRKLANYQKEARPSLREAAKIFMLQELYLNADAPEISCEKFILALQVDTVRRTFWFERSSRDGTDTLVSLHVLSAVGLLEVLPEKAFVRREHLGLVNEFLRRIRTPAAPAGGGASSELIEVGNIAEDLAVGDEKARLTRAGYPELALLVKRISAIDTSAGYDVVSHRGTGSQPDSQIFIEVKGTRKLDASFVWSRNERAVAELKRNAYWLYVYTAVDVSARTATGPVRIDNPIARLESLGFSMQPMDVYVCRAAQ